MINKKKIIIGSTILVVFSLAFGGYFAYGKVNDFLIASKEKEENFEAMKTQLETQIEEQEVKIEELEEFRNEQIENEDSENQESLSSSNALSEDQINRMIYCDKYKETYTTDRYNKMIERPDDEKKECIKITKKGHEMCEEMNRDENCDKKYDTDKCDENKKEAQDRTNEWIVKYNEYNKRCK
ncbi:MAG: hypothetical protein OEV93_03295 [Candidatus Moranbacteria bacterium]|nr:hypothetical protein [Candidatus Moranbacteria bacterium]